MTSNVGYMANLFLYFFFVVYKGPVHVKKTHNYTHKYFIKREKIVKIVWIMTFAAMSKYTEISHECQWKAFGFQYQHPRQFVITEVLIGYMHLNMKQ